MIYKVDELRNFSSAAQKANVWITENMATVEKMISKFIFTHFFGNFEFARPSNDECLSIAYLAAVKAWADFRPELNYTFTTYYHKVFWSAMTVLLKSDSQALENRFINYRLLAWSKKSGKKAKTIASYSMDDENSIDLGHTDRSTDDYDASQSILELYDNDPRKVFDMLTDGLEKRDKEVLWMRFGDGIKLEEIGRKIGVSKERVRQLLERIMEHVAKQTVILQKLVDIFQIYPHDTKSNIV